MNFKLGDGKLLIDTTYNLVLTDFKAHLSESPSDYPEIVNWLKKPTTELQHILNQLNKLDCDKVNTFWIQSENSEQVDIFKFEWKTGCNQRDLGQLNLVFNEMKKVKEKYKD
jgi:hypothetical protein